MRARRKQKSWYESKPSFPISLSTLPDTGELSITALDLEQYSKLAFNCSSQSRPFKIIFKFWQPFFSNWRIFKKNSNYFPGFLFWCFINFPLGHVRSHTKFWLDHWGRFDVYIGYKQTNKQTDKQRIYIYNIGNLAVPDNYTLMLELLFFLISKLNNACSPLQIN